MYFMSQIIMVSSLIVFSVSWSHSRGTFVSFEAVMMVDTVGFSGKKTKRKEEIVNKLLFICM